MVSKNFSKIDKKVLIGVVLILAIVGLVTFTLLFLWQKPSQPALQPSPQQSSPTPTPTSTPTSQPTSSDRAETFIISGSEEFPHFTKELKINPFYDAKIEETLSFSIWAEDPEGIEKVTATIITEKGKKEINLTLVEGTKEKGKWQGKWKIEDVLPGTSPDIIFKAENTKGKKTQLSTYFHIQAEQAEEESFLRKIFSFFKTKEALAAVQCPLPASGNTTISSNCYIPQNTEVGVEGGNLTIRATITMERNSTLKFNQGKSINMGSNGYILKSASNTVITKGHVTITYTLTVSKSGTGSGTVTSNPAGINCGSDCSENYPDGTSVTLTADPASGSTFAGWSGDCSGTGNCTITMDSNKSVTATFNAAPTCDSTSYTSCSSAKTMSNGQTISGMCGSQYYKINLSQTCDVTWTVTPQGSADYDLYARANACPSKSSYGCRSTAGSGSVDSCTLNDVSGTVYAYVYKYSDNSNQGYSISVSVSNCYSCECSSGPCCDGCNYRSSSYVCNSNYDQGYSCRYGTGCGDDVWEWHKVRYCSGSSSSCNGSVSGKIWDGVADYCSSDERCAEGDPTCNYDSSCVTTECTPGSGPCCDASGNYRPSSYICDTQTQTDYGCPWGTGCGDDVGVRTRTRNRYCSGSSSSCNGSWGSWSSWSSWLVQDYCSSDERCANDDPTCNYDSSCVGPSCPDCQSNHTDSCDGKCEYDCGASSSCDERSPSSSWASGSTCKWCNSSCAYGSDSSKPADHYLSSNTCYYDCNVSCNIGGWTRSGCSSASCPPTTVAGNTCYYDRGCYSTGCGYNSWDSNKECASSVCTTSGWDNSSCQPPTCTNITASPNPALCGQTTFTASGSNIQQAKAKVYNLAASLVWESSWTSGSSVIWNGRNNSGQKVASGTYLYQMWVKNPNGTDDCAIQKSVQLNQADADGDGYLNPVCGGSDCCDSDANVFPGQWEYYTSKNNCNSWDYNCNGQEDKYWTNIGYCNSCSGGTFDGQYGWKNDVAYCGELRTYYAGCKKVLFWWECKKPGYTQKCR